MGDFAQPAQPCLGISWVQQVSSDVTVFALDIGFTARYRDHIPVGIGDKPPQKVAPDNAGRSGYERCFLYWCQGLSLL